jgi:hypothetical protein
MLPWPVAVGAFVVGWVFQFVGHGYEGKKPAFFTNLVHLLVGPLWIVSLAMPRTSKATQPDAFVFSLRPLKQQQSTPGRVPFGQNFGEPSSAKHKVMLRGTRDLQRRKCRL